ncbi:unnamed protein product, partial [Urochloa humidicola]
PLPPPPSLPPTPAAGPPAAAPDAAPRTLPRPPPALPQLPLSPPPEQIVASPVSTSLATPATRPSAAAAILPRDAAAPPLAFSLGLMPCRPGGSGRSNRSRTGRRKSPPALGCRLPSYPRPPDSPRPDAVGAAVHRISFFFSAHLQDVVFTLQFAQRDAPKQPHLSAAGSTSAPYREGSDGARVTSGRWPLCPLEALALALRYLKPPASPSCASEAAAQGPGDTAHKAWRRAVPPSPGLSMRPR